MYLSDSGEIQIVKTIDDVDVNILNLGSSDIFGEMTLITESRRVASAMRLLSAIFMLWIGKHFFVVSGVLCSAVFLSSICLALVRRGMKFI